MEITEVFSHRADLESAIIRLLECGHPHRFNVLLDSSRIEMSDMAYGCVTREEIVR